MIEIHNLSKSFGNLEVLKNINLRIDEQEVVVLIGASGSGKSTLLRCLNFLEVAQSGDIIIDSEKIERAKTDLRLYLTAPPSSPKAADKTPIRDSSAELRSPMSTKRTAG